MWFFRLFRTLFLLILFILFVGIGAVGLGSVAEWKLRQQVVQRFPAPGKMVAIGNYRLHLNCVGRGAPTVILEAGLGPQGSLIWSDLQAEVSKSTRACSYDRAGHNWSDPSPLPRRGRNISLELQRLLAQSGEKGPYLLVGHSLGGSLIRLFYREQKDQVAGMVFLDSSHPRQEEFFGPEVLESDHLKWRAMAWLSSVTGAERVYQWLFGPVVPDRFPLNALSMAQSLIPQSLQANTEEWLLMSQTLQDEGSLDNLSGVPIRVLIPGKPQMPREAESIWLGMQQEIAASGGLDALEQVPGAGHYLYLDRPDAVIRNILELVQDFRKKQ